MYMRGASYGLLWLGLRALLIYGQCNSYLTMFPTFQLYLLFEKLSYYVAYVHNKIFGSIAILLRDLLIRILLYIVLNAALGLT